MLKSDNSLDIHKYINECNPMELTIKKVKQNEIFTIINNLRSKRATGNDRKSIKVLKEFPMDAISFKQNMFNALS